MCVCVCVCVCSVTLHYDVCDVCVCVCVGSRECVYSRATQQNDMCVRACVCVGGCACVCARCARHCSTMCVCDTSTIFASCVSLQRVVSVYHLFYAILGPECAVCVYECVCVLCVCCVCVCVVCACVLCACVLCVCVCVACCVVFVVRVVPCWGVRV